MNKYQKIISFENEIQLYLENVITFIILNHPMPSKFVIMERKRVERQKENRKITKIGRFLYNFDVFHRPLFVVVVCSTSYKE